MDVSVAASPLRLLAALALALAAPAQAVGFSADLPFTDVASADHLPLLGGSLDVRTPAGRAPALMHNVSGFTVSASGLAVACWESTCHRAVGTLAVQVLAGSTVALRYPQAGDLHLVAAHAVAAPVDLQGQRSGLAGLPAGLDLAPSLVAATQSSRLVLETKLVPSAVGGPLPTQGPPGTPSPGTSLFEALDPDDADGAVLATLTPQSRLVVLDGGQVVHGIEGPGALVLQGAIQVDPVSAEAFVLPCAIRCEVSITTRGEPGDLQAATASIVSLAEIAQGAPLPPVDLGPWSDLLDPMADGVYVDLPLLADPGQFRVASLTVARFDEFHAALGPGAAPAPGSGPLVIRSGSVQGSPEFVGGRYFGMPPWSWLLWAAAVAAIVVAAVRRAPKSNERWDRLYFVGWLTGAAAWAVLVFVWHRNFGHVLGVNMETPGLSPSSRAVVAAVEGATLLAMALMVVLPTRLLLSRAFRLLRQGNLMGLAGPASTVVGILAGPPLLLGFLDLALRLAQ
jgi:hypothetical protein